jgi:hypothetical protein
MAYTRTSFARVSNTRISSRYNQLIALIGAIVIGMIISSMVNAVPSAKSTAASKMTVNFQQK